ncbi:MAG: DUF3106 domain-containing protein, partial [Planctomycetota bacterium]
MTRSLLHLLATSAFALLLATPVALALDGDPVPEFLVAAAGDESDEELRARRAEAKRRWEAMTPEQREKIKKRFERFKKLPEAKQKELAKRFRRMGGPEGTRAMGEHIRKMRTKSPEHMKRMRRRGTMMRGLHERFVKTLPPEIREKVSTLDAEKRDA